MPKSPVALEFIAERSDLLAFLMSASRVANGKPIPVYGFARLSANAEAVFWWAASGELWRGDQFLATVQAPGDALLPVAQAKSLLQRCPDGPVRLVFTATDVTVTTGQVTAKWQTLPIEDFPTRPELPMDGAKLSSAALRSLITRVLPAVNLQSGNYYSRGALLSVTPEAVTCVSTDGHQLGKAIAAAVSTGDVHDTIIPRDALEELGHMLDQDAAEVMCAYVDPRHIFKAGTAVLVSRAVEAQFPAYERIFPKKRTTRLTWDRAGMAAAVRRVLLATDKESRRVRFASNGDAIKVSAESRENGDVAESVSVTCEGPASVFCLNGHYVLNFLDAATAESVLCDIDSDLAPILFSAKDDGDVDYQYVISQIRA